MKKTLSIFCFLCSTSALAMHDKAITTPLTITSTMGAPSPDELKNIGEFDTYELTDERKKELGRMGTYGVGLFFPKLNWVLSPEAFKAFDRKMAAAITEKNKTIETYTISHNSYKNDIHKIFTKLWKKEKSKIKYKDLLLPFLNDNITNTIKGLFGQFSSSYAVILKISLFWNKMSVNK